MRKPLLLWQVPEMIMFHVVAISSQEHWMLSLQSPSKDVLRLMLGPRLVDSLTFSLNEVREKLLPLMLDMAN
jgi:hypothetical protein